MSISDHQLAWVGIYVSILPTLAIIYFDWKRRRADRYQRAKDWLTKSISHMHGFIWISTELYQDISQSTPASLDRLEAVDIAITKESVRFLINKAQDLFLSRDSLRQVQTIWDDLDQETRTALRGTYPFVFKENDLLFTHRILQQLQDGEAIAVDQLKEWQVVNASFCSSLECAVRVMSLLRMKIGLRFPIRK